MKNEGSLPEVNYQDVNPPRRNKTGKLVLLETDYTPLIVFEPMEGLLEMRGNCTPDNSIAFFEPLSSVLDYFNAKFKKDLVANFRIGAISGTSLKCLFEIIRKLSFISDAGHKLEIYWYFQTGDLYALEIGKDYADLTGLNFTFIAEEEKSK